MKERGGAKLVNKWIVVGTHSVLQLKEDELDVFCAASMWRVSCTCLRDIEYTYIHACPKEHPPPPSESSLQGGGGDYVVEFCFSSI